jgi:hypothetical protein
MSAIPGDEASVSVLVEVPPDVAFQVFTEESAWEVVVYATKPRAGKRR